MTKYELRRDHPRTARIRPVGVDDLRPLAWLRITYTEHGHEVVRIDVYSHAAAVLGRLWRGSASTVTEAVAFCHDHAAELHELSRDEPLPPDLPGPPVHPWGFSTVVDVG